MSAVVLLLLGMAGCMTFPDSPSNGKADTFGDPLIVTRDNLAIDGNMYVYPSNDWLKTVTGKVGSDTNYLSDAQWWNATAYTKIEEFRAVYQWDGKPVPPSPTPGGPPVPTGKSWYPKGKYQDFYTPLLPSADFWAPGTARFATRAGVMVHGNIYQVSAAGEGGGNQSAEVSGRHVKLSDDVLVVPVVVASWRDPSAMGYTDQSVATAGAIDFLPAAPMPWVPLPYFQSGPNGTQVDAYRLRSPTISQYDVRMAWSDLWPGVTCPWENSPFDWLCEANYDQTGASGGTLPYTPDKRWTPPDEIWTKCNIQFQVIDTVTLDLPAGWNWLNGTCNQGLENTPSVLTAYTDHYAGTDLESWSKYVANTLHPVFVNFADFPCSWVWDGSTKGIGSNIVEIGNYADPITLPHELGHAVGLDHYKGAQGDNIMRQFDQGRNIDVAAQCGQARITAGGYSKRFDEFNRVTGRTYSDTPVPNLDDIANDPGDGGPGPFDPQPNGHCCLLQDASDVTVSQQACTTTELPIEKCTIQCCSNNQDLTTYKCEKLGFTSYYCPPS
jgi:hypothetical protein